MNLCRALYGLHVWLHPGDFKASCCVLAAVTLLGPVHPGLFCVWQKESVDDSKQAVHWGHTWLARWGQCWAVSSQSVLAPLSWQDLDVHVLLAVPWQLCENLAVKVPGWVCMFSSVALGTGRENSCRSRTADWPWFVGLCFLFHFKTGVWCFSEG